MVVGEFADSVDLLVLGGGPGGYAAAIRAAQLGREVTLVERAGPAGLGGVCLQVGCIPSKALIELADAAQRTRDLHAAGLSADGVGVSLERFQAWRGELCAGLARGVGALLAAGDMRVVHGEARFNRADRVAVHTPEDRVVFFEFEHAIIATGSRPVALPGLPFDGERVLDSTGALALTAVPASVAVVGAGYIGLELGTALAKLGARVTVVEALDRVLPTVEESLTAPVLGACARSASTCGCARPRSAWTTARSSSRARRGGPRRGRARRRRRRPAPNTDELGLAEAGVAVGADGLIAVGEDMRATDRIAAVGDVVAGPALAHKATAEAAVAAEALSGQPRGVRRAGHPGRDLHRPRDRLGRAQRGAGPRGRAWTPWSPPSRSPPPGRAGTLGARDGFTRIVADAATDRVVGVHVVGPHASELVAGGALAIELMAAPGDVAATIHPHPTLSEGLREAAELMLGQPLHVAARGRRLSSRSRPRAIAVGAAQAEIADVRCEPCSAVAASICSNHA